MPWHVSQIPITSEKLSDMSRGRWCYFELTTYASFRLYFASSLPTLYYFSFVEE
jgi:hypothetical protein